MSDLKNIKEPVVNELLQFKTEFESSLRSSEPFLQRAIDVILDKNGKQLRPLLVLLTAKACGKMNQMVINSAVFLELIHTATLIHDDVVDETKLRRGAPSLNAIFDNRVSVLVGDYILATAMSRSLLTGDLRIVNIVSSLGRELAEGELKQLKVVDEIVLNKEAYIEIIRKKTASLLSACMEIGAISSGASDELVALGREAGQILGYCFQIKDDIFDYFVAENIGKPTGNDIREGKVTLPLLYALETGRREEVEKARHILAQKDFSPENIQFLLDWAKESGGIDYATQCMQEYHAKAIELILQLPDNDGRESLLQLADYIISRKK
ncbi:polyprenyl synthetase family protein [Parabacteroides sp. PFB2-10]|uniref:polyprenyl synthetase family protein n=1 Tax=Parabacteroides sp. PFB2-10 TaxID=1742405 RepID=UPI0024743C1F|nr:polyprenyl synthetase family protein [Parabacteroides sp. PFB2-10]